jgi:hypothetical protein
MNSDTIAARHEFNEYEFDRKYSRVEQLRVQIRNTKAELNQLKHELGLEPDDN